MQILQEFKNDELIYDNINDTTFTQSVDINSETLLINYNDIIDTQFTGGNMGELSTQLKNDLNLGIYSKAPCGGFVNFYKVSSNLGGFYIIYSGVNEVSNSHYIVTVHKIFKVAL